MRVYEAIVAGLEAIGVDAVFGGAGENAAGMMLALDKSDIIRPVITKNEQAAAFMACGYAMFSNRLGVCFATAGPGAFNLVSGLCVALTDSYPLLAITGYSTVAWSGRGGLNETSGLNRTPDSRKIFQAVTKADFLIEDLDEVAATLQRAIDIAFDGRPGPVHVAVAEDITDPSMKVTKLRPAQNQCEAGHSRSATHPRYRRVPYRRDQSRQEGRPARGLRRHSRGRQPRGSRVHRALPDPSDHHAGRQGHCR